MKLMWPVRAQLSGRVRGAVDYWTHPWKKTNREGEWVGRGCETDWIWCGLSEMDGNGVSSKHEHWGKKRTLNNMIGQRWPNLYWITLAGSIKLMCKYSRWQILVSHLLNYVADPGTSQSLHWKHYSHLCQLYRCRFTIEGIRWWDKNIFKCFFQGIQLLGCFCFSFFHLNQGKNTIRHFIE